MASQAKAVDKEKKNQENLVQTGGSLFELNLRNETQDPSPEQYVYLDSFDEDETEQKFLLSKPACFLVIGKPGVGKTTIAKKLAQEWKAEFINPTEIILQNIKNQTEIGKKAQDILMKGEAVSESMVAKMIDDKVNSPEVAHHGYVLEGFPCQSDTNFDIGQQMEILKNWKLQPDFIVNLRLSDGDLVHRRLGQRVDPISGNVYVKEMYQPKVKQPKKQKGEETNEEEEGEEEHGEEEEEETSEEPQDEFFALVASDVVARLVFRPEDTAPHVHESIKQFKEASLHVLEDQMASMDQSYLIELDSNLSPTILIKQLILRLQSYGVPRAAKPLRMNDAIESTEEEAEAHIIDNGESEETLNALQLRRRLAPRFKWRRSKCSYYCPVNLKDGKIAIGKSEYAASFLDKIYMMADEHALAEFLKNPRPYLRLPQPRAPCKLSVNGFTSSGKTTLCSLMAKKYNAKVINMESLMEPDLRRAKEEMLEVTRADAIQQAVEIIKIKFKEKLEQERLKKDQELAAAAEALEAQEATETESGEVVAENAEQKSAENIDEKSSNPEKVDHQGKQVTIAAESISTIESDKMVYLSEDGEIIVDDDHPEIKLSVERALEEAEKQIVTLPATSYVTKLQIELEKMRKERQKLDPTASNDGGWILDNFPTAPDQLEAMVESNIIPDTIIILQDSSEDSNVLMRRWYSENRESIDAKIAKRLAEEEALRQEEKKRLDELKKSHQIDTEFDDETTEKPTDETKGKEATDGTAAAAAAAAAGAGGAVDEAGQKPLEKILEEDESKDGAHGRHHARANTLTIDPDMKTIQTSVEPQTPKAQLIPPKGIEYLDFINTVKNGNEQIRNLQNKAYQLIGNDCTVIEINKKTNSSEFDEMKSVDDICNEAYESIERIFKFQAHEHEGGEEEEGDEGEEEEAEPEEEESVEDDEMDEDEEEDIFDPTLKEKKIQFGETCHYCPVNLHKYGTLVPGNPEMQLKYREKIYRFRDDDSRALFMENPMTYLPNSRKSLKIPPPRILILGPKGSGKSTQARYLADQLNIFHIKFKEYLQELIIGKVKKPVEPEREEDREQEQEEEEEEDDDPNAKPKEKQEENLPELTDREETIKAYLEKEETLPNDIIDEVLSQLWNSEPFKSRGFVLDGFPNNDNEANYLIERGFFPDAFIILKLEDENIIKRLLPPRFQRWQAKMNAKKERKKQKALRKKEKLMKRMKERKDEEIAKFEEKRKEKEREAEENGEEYEEEEFDVDALIQEEFQDELQEEEETEEVQEDEVKENMTNDIKSNFENQINAIESSRDVLQEAFIPRFTVDGNRKPNIVRYLIRKRLERFIEHRQSLFERVYLIKYKPAIKLIDFGYKKLSRFGRWCPVKLLEDQPVQPLYDEKKKPHTVIHRSYIYFLSSKDAKKKFIEDPIKYLKQPSPLSVVPFRLSIIGPPKSGKTTLANRFVKEFGCVRLSVGEAIRAILESQPNTILAREIQSHLIKGKTVPDELAIQCIEIAILDVKCQLRGYILDGYPVSRQQVKLMTERSLIPVKVIELKCEIREIMQRCIKDRTSSDRLSKNLILNDSPEIIGYKVREWKNEIIFIHDWYNNEHKNLIQLNGHQSKWSIWEQAKKIGFESVRLIQVYLNRISNQRAASISKLCVTYDEMLNRLGDFGQYCPVSLALRDELVDCSENRSMDFVAEYQGYYYKMYSENELKLFLQSPDKFVPPKAQKKLPPPALLPKKRTQDEIKALFPKQIELNGYCPVTYYDGKLRYESIELGFIEYAVEYKNKIFYMNNLEAREKFMRKPELYANLVLPHKLPPLKNQLNVLNLPMAGYLEQTVADLIKKSLTAVGNFKPKFPFLSPTRSALLYIAYYLKTYNPKSSEFRRKKYKQKLAYFEEQCQLINFLYSQTTLKYKEPSKRSTEYNAKFESFFALQDNAPTTNWLS